MFPCLNDGVGSEELFNLLLASSSVHKHFLDDVLPVGKITQNAGRKGQNLDHLAKKVFSEEFNEILPHLKQGEVHNDHSDHRPLVNGIHKTDLRSHHTGAILVLDGLDEDDEISESGFEVTLGNEEFLRRTNSLKTLHVKPSPNLHHLLHSTLHPRNYDGLQVDALQQGNFGDV